MKLFKIKVKNREVLRGLPREYAGQVFQVYNEEGAKLYGEPAYTFYNNSYHRIIIDDCDIFCANTKIGGKIL